MVVNVIWNCRTMLKKFYFLTLNANIFQSVWSNSMKFLPHDIRQIKYRILWLDSTKTFLLFSWMNKAKVTVLSGFWQKNGLGPLEIDNRCSCDVVAFMVYNGGIVRLSNLKVGLHQGWTESLLELLKQWLVER